MPKNVERKVREYDKDFSKTALEGTIRETLATAIFLKNGYSVSKPVVTSRYDLIVEKNMKFARIQVKNLKLDYIKNPDNKLSVDQFVIRAFTNSITNSKKSRNMYSIEDIDFVFATNIETGDFALVPVETIPKTGIVRMSERCSRKECFNSFNVLDSFCSNTKNMS